MRATESEIQIEDASRLAAYLRERPSAFDESAESIAEKFGLPVGFVEQVFSSLGRPRASAALAPAISGAKRLLFMARMAFRHLTRNPTGFIASTTALGIGVFILLDGLFGSRAAWMRSGVGSLSGLFNANPGVFYAVALVTMAIQQACYFRHGQIRFALLGGVWAWSISAVTVMALGWIRLRGQADAPVIAQLLMLAFVMFVLCALYSMLSVVTAVLGGVYWVRKHEEAKERRSRQELIEHLFELKERLNSNLGEAIQIEEPSFWRRFTLRMRKWFIPVAIAGGVAWSILSVGTTLALRATIGSADSNVALMTLTLMSVEIARVFGMSLVAYIGGRLERALFAAILFEIATIPLQLIPFEPYGMFRLKEAFQPDTMVITFGAAIVVGALAALGARVEERAAYHQRLYANDRAALLAEVVRTEWQLELQTVHVCVLVVDVVRSSMMKALAPPLEVEYSFREYQRYVAHVCHRYDGIVHSTAGDGAVVAFYDCSNAFEAAIELQRGMAEFNATKNRLKTPFRVRIGLHMGVVAGDLNDVQFSEVIDIAAHFESAAPPDGIALSAPVAEQAPSYRLEHMPDPISGQMAYVYLPLEERD